MIPSYQINYQPNNKKTNEAVLTCLYGSIISSKAFFLYSYLRNQKTTWWQLSLNYPLELLYKIIKTRSRQQLTRILNSLKAVQLLDWKYQADVQTYLFNLQNPKLIEAFLADKKLSAKLQKRFSANQIQEIRSALTDGQPSKQQVSIWEKLKFPLTIKKKMKVRDFNMINKIYHDNQLSIAILQKIIDFTQAQTNNLHGAYIEKITEILRAKKILHQEKKLTAYLSKVYQNKKITSVNHDHDLADWLMVPSYRKSDLKIISRFKKLFDS